MALTGYKLFRVRRAGSLGPLFVERRRVRPLDEWLTADMDLEPRGLATRPGWHVLLSPEAPHLSRRGRTRRQVEAQGIIDRFVRPESQGGLWILARQIRIPLSTSCPHEARQQPSQSILTSV